MAFDSPDRRTGVPNEPLTLPLPLVTPSLTGRVDPGLHQRFDCAVLRGRGEEAQADAGDDQWRSR